jgi:hypothetical protein
MVRGATWSTQMSLSPAATIVLTRAAERPDHRLEFHRKLPTGGRHKMIDALLRDGLIVETQGDYRLGDGALLIEDSATGLMLTTLALTDAGFRALNLDPPGTDETPDTPGPQARPQRRRLRCRRRPWRSPMPWTPPTPRPWRRRAPTCATPPRRCWSLGRPGQPRDHHGLP